MRKTVPFVYLALIAVADFALYKATMHYCTGEKSTLLYLSMFLFMFVMDFTLCVMFIVFAWFFRLKFKFFGYESEIRMTKK